MKIKKIDQIENITIADSFVKYNKIGSGAGEARLYVGTLTATNDFFDIMYNNKIAKAFVLKKDLSFYMADSEFEYKNPSYPYRTYDYLSDAYISYTQKIFDLHDIEFFDIEFALDKDPKGRCYIRACDTSKSSIYTFLREILLPNISKFDIIKVLLDEEIKYWFIPRIDVQYNRYNQSNNIERIEQTIESDTEIKETTKISLIESRIGQGEFRDKLITEMVACPITFIDDARLLIASHIKPWSISDNSERLDCYNGLLLTPNIDKLFDQGLITFETPNELKYSPYLSDTTIEKLKLGEYSPNIIHFDKREKYMEYHRDNIFQKLG